MKKYSLILIIAAAVIIEVMGAAQYIMARRGIRQELLAKAERDVKESQRVAMVRGEVESAIRNIMPNVTKAVSKPEIFATLTARIVKNNPNIVGAGIAFPEGFYKNKKGLYAPNSFDDRPANELLSQKKGTPNIHSTVLGFDYTDREWFQKPMKENVSLWTEPYIDKGGTHILMITFTAPVKIGDKTVGVFFADVPLKDASILSENLHADVSDSGVKIIVMQIISLLLLGFIIWRAVLASRRYKEQVVDPEKEHLVNQMTKLKEINNKLIKRNQDLAQKYMELQRRTQNESEQNSHGTGLYFQDYDERN